MDSPNPKSAMSNTDPGEDRGQNHCLKETMALAISSEAQKRRAFAWYFQPCLRAADTAQLYDCVVNWIAEFDSSLAGCAVGMDGKLCADHTQ